MASRKRTKPVLFVEVDEALKAAIKRRVDEEAARRPGERAPSESDIVRAILHRELLSAG